VTARPLTTVLTAAALLAGFAAPAAAIQVFESEDGAITFDFTGYAQPYYRWVDNPQSFRVTEDGVDVTRSRIPDGFGLSRVRLGFEGDYAERGSFKLELNTVPNVELLEARFSFDPLPWLRLNVGRFKVPFSRQELTSESALQIIDRAAFISATPGRQLGVSADIQFGFGSLPDDFLTISAGIFNGESAKERAPINNIDEHFLYAARLEIAPFGQPERGEGDLRPMDERSAFQLVLGGSWSYEVRGPSNGDYEQRNVGGDVLARWHGVSIYSEVFRMDRDFEADLLNADFGAFGYNVQLGFFVPAPYVEEHLELVGRVEEWDPARAHDPDRAAELRPTAAGAGPAQTGGTQATRSFTGGLNWYFFGHDLKLQANYTHRQALENTVLSAENAEIPMDVDDDTFFVQLTARF
jgi:hypothetical protein